MWQVDNRTPFAAEGAEVWLVAVKATLDILEDGSAAPAQEQSLVLRVPEYHGNPYKSSIKYEADVVLTKRCADIIGVGHAHAPPGTAVTQLGCGFKFGGLQEDRTGTPYRHRTERCTDMLPPRRSGRVSTRGIEVETRHRPRPNRGRSGRHELERPLC